tara:strand:+ start:481 stop:705 length:225 start_codon:yes stop_codon:yes gene_type:complete
MKKKLNLLQRLTDELFRLRPKVMRDPRTKAELLVRARYHRVEDIIRKRYGSIYLLSVLHGSEVIVSKGKNEIII